MKPHKRNLKIVVSFLSKTALLLLILVSSCSPNIKNTIDLSGEWYFSLDPKDEGEIKKWFETKLSDSIKLPGSMASNNKGFKITPETEWTGTIKDTAWFLDHKFAPYYDPENFRIPFWLQPEKKYTGAAWYQKEIIIPGEWENREVSLKLERCHWETTVWLDSNKLGSQNSLATPHIYRMNPGSGKHLLTIRVDNRVDNIDPGVNSHSITDHTQTNWNGIIGDISLQCEDKFVVRSLQIFPDISNKAIDVIALVTSRFDDERSVQMVAEVALVNGDGASKYKPLKMDLRLSPGENEIKFNYKLGEHAPLWDEFDPNLYRLNVQLSHKGILSESVQTFGLREIKTDKGQILLNDRKLFLRGTLECAIFPKTGYPAMQKEEWTGIYRTIKSYGLNHMRFHSWCPPEAAFAAADEEGVYLQVECGSWANGSTTLGDGKPIDNFIWEESKRIIETYGNHPSFCLMAYGNEPGGANDQNFLAEFVSYWKKQDGRRIYTSAAGWPMIPENEFHNVPSPRIQKWNEQLASVINAEPPKTDYDWHSRNRMPDDEIPVVSHEIGQWCVYPNFNEIEKYSGVLKAKNFEIFRESLNANGMGNLADQFTLASGELQVLCYKADIEAALRTKGFGGFQLLDLHDFPGQGTALVGVLDAFWEEKGYVTGEEYRRFCNEVVPLARMDRRIFLENDTMKVDIEVANFYKEELADIEPSWKLLSDQKDIIAEGLLEKRDIQVGNGIHLGALNFPIPETGNPRKRVLQVTVAGYVNSWDVWFYPQNQGVLSNLNIYFTEILDDKATKALKEGKNVLLSLGKGKVKAGKGGEVGVGFSSIFWNTAWTGGQKPHTLGILCDPDHPALKLFPSEYHSNWQWWDAMSHADVINLDAFSQEIKPIIRVIDDWFTNRPLGLLIEMKIGKGNLLISGVDLYNNLDSRPEARQLLVSLDEYMNSSSFNPEVSVEIEELLKIIQ